MRRELNHIVSLQLCGLLSDDPASVVNKFTCKPEARSWIGQAGSLASRRRSVIRIF